MPLGANCCEVSRAAFYERKKDVLSDRDASEASLTEQITAILMRRAALEGRCKKRWCRTTVTDPTPSRPGT